MLARGIRAGYLLMDSWFAFPALLAKLEKRPGKARILASVAVTTKKDQQVKIGFLRHPRQWLAILSTKINRADGAIVRIYGKRCPREG